MKTKGHIYARYNGSGNLRPASIDQQEIALLCKPYEDVANAIVLQAVADYRRAMRKLNKNPGYGPALYTKREVERFFRSCWFAELTCVDPTILLSELKKEGS